MFAISQFATALSVFPQVWDIAILEFEGCTDDGFGEDEIHPFTVGSPGTQDKLAEEVWTHQVVDSRSSLWIMRNDAKVHSPAKGEFAGTPGPEPPNWRRISDLNEAQLKKLLLSPTIPEGVLSSYLSCKTTDKKELLEAEEKMHKEKSKQIQAAIVNIHSPPEEAAP